MIDSSYDRSTIIDSIELFMFSTETIEISESLMPLTDTDDIIDIGDLVWMLGIDSDRPSVDLIGTHVGTHSSEIDEGIHSGAVPPLSEDSSRPDDESRFSTRELLGDGKDRLICEEGFFSILESPDSLS